MFIGIDYKLDVVLFGLLEMIKERFLFIVGERFLILVRWKMLNIKRYYGLWNVFIFIILIEL